MRIRIKADGRTLYNAELVTFFRCEGLSGRAELAPASGELTVELELGARDRVLLAPQKNGAPWRAVIATPATLPTDRLDD